MEIMKVISVIFGLSVTGSHLKQLLVGLIWAFRSLHNKGNLGLAARNHIVAAFLDSILGILILHWLLGVVNPQMFVHSALEAAEEVVVQLRSLIIFLMGSPGGLKLNLPFNQALGRFFIHNTNLWWDFIDNFQPYLFISFRAFKWLGLLGFTTHLAIASDLLALANFHAYCIYVYAARLFSWQVRGLTALWRLFLGRKWNPLRQCVDSCDYQPSQLFAGVLAFTVLVFLLPTTSIYYAVFTSLRLFFLAVEGLLIRLRFTIQTLPVYAFLMWLFRSQCICTNISMSLIRPKGDNDACLKLHLQPERKALTAVVKSATSPVPLPKPPAIEWSLYLKNIATGTLI